MLTRGGDEDGEDKGYLCGGNIRSFFNQRYPSLLYVETNQGAYTL
jgi:hypothetical protein